MLKKSALWLKNNTNTLESIGSLLIAATPIALVAGRAAADVAVSIAAILFLFDSIRNNRWSWAKEPWSIAALSLWAFGIAREGLLSQGAYPITETLAWVRYIIFAASVKTWALATTQSRKRLLISTITAVAFLSADGLFQYIFGKDIFGRPRTELSNIGVFRLTGLYRRPILGITIANLFAPAIFWLLEEKKIKASATLAILCMTTVFLSGDRMGLMMAIAIMGVWGLLLIKEIRKKWMIAAIAVILSLALAVSAPDMAKRQIASTAKTITNLTSSAYWMAWKSAWDVGKDNLAFGVGIRQFRVTCPDEKYGPLIDEKTGYSRCYNHPHNIYMEWFAEYGIVGLIGMIALSATILAEIIRRIARGSTSPLLLGVGMMLAIRLLPVFASTSFFSSWSAIPFWLALGWAMSYPTIPPSCRT